MKKIYLHGAAAVGDNQYALVDDDLYSFLALYTWYAKQAHEYGKEAVYVVTHLWLNGEKKQVYMHRFIMNPSPTRVVNHEDGIPTNNQRSNLRIMTRKQNSELVHKSSFKGCFFDRRYGIWWCRLGASNNNESYGNYDTEIDCAIAYNHARLNKYGPNQHESVFNDVPNWRNIIPQRHVKRKYIYKSNTSGVPGVTWNKRNKVWNVSIGVGAIQGVQKKSLYIGSFKVKYEAVKARYEAELKYLGHSDINPEDFRDE